MFERFGWRRLGGSVFRYEKSKSQEDWLNEVVPAIMFFRSYVLAHGINVKFFTLDAGSITRIDFSDPAKTLGRQPVSGSGLKLRVPTNKQSSVKTIKRFVSSARKVLQ
jgi:hypothetical protein